MRTRSGKSPAATLPMACAVGARERSAQTAGPAPSAGLGVPDRVVMEILGWSNTAMLRRYQHITGKVRRMWLSDSTG